MKLSPYILTSLLLSGSLNHLNTNALAPKDINPKPHKVLPNGCREYFFAADGTYSTERMLKSRVVYTCIASKDKSAIKKFNNWLKNNSLDDGFVNK